MREFLGRVLVRSAAALAFVACGPVRESEESSKVSAPPAGSSTADIGHSPHTSSATRFGVSPPLRSIPPARSDGLLRQTPKFRLPLAASSATDPVRQSIAPILSAPALIADFRGLGDGFIGLQGATFTVQAAPPDTNGDVGPNRYVQIVNSSIAVFDKSGTVLLGPKLTKALWSGFGGGCETNSDGDGTVKYDKAADRWVITQFSVSTTPFLECVAVSTSGDPTGSYARYSFQYTDFPDYPKLGVWPDAYYVTYNMFNAAGTVFLGPQVCALERSKMLAGSPAQQVCFPLDPTFGSLLPADVDGPTAPPAGSPNFLLSLGTTSNLDLWKFQVDFATPANSTLTGPTSIPVADFAPACGGGNCIPQPGTTTLLDSLGDRLMYRLAYRNFGDHESLVANHSITSGNAVGVRWYEVRSPNATPILIQQGTYAPSDSNDRWMGSIAMDKQGNIALGFSISGPSRKPGIRYTGRFAGDPLGTMTQGEGTLIAGSGSQTVIPQPNGTVVPLIRWGDYSSISVDPSDDCTFWYTNEYLKVDGVFNWSTQIGSFRLSCSSAVITPGIATVPPGGSLAFLAFASSGTGLWSLATNASGGSIVSESGLYTAGRTGSVTDIVQVTDTAGAARRVVTVTAGVSISPATPSVPPKGSLTFGALGGSGTGFTWSLPTNASGATVDAATGAYKAGATGSVTDVLQVTDSLGNIATRTVAVSAGVSISLAADTVPPKGSATFTASGGSGIGFTWSLATNASGGSIVAGTGAYTAGATGGVTDTVQVTDSLGNTATRNVAVSAGVSISPATASVTTKGSITFAAAGGSGTGFAWSLPTNASGGSINATTGLYTAGGTGTVTDTVQVTDSLGNGATRSVTVTAPPSGGGCATAGAADVSWVALLMLVVGAQRRRRVKDSRSCAAWAAQPCGEASAAEAPRPSPPWA